MEKTNNPYGENDIELEYVVLVEDIVEYGEDDNLTELEVAEIAERVKDYIFDSYNQFIADACSAIIEERPPVKPVSKKKRKI